MKTVFKRLLCLLLVLAVTGTTVPSAYAQDSEATKAEATVFTQEDYAPIDNLFAQIDAMEEAHAKKNPTQTQLADEAQALVEASENYVEGSLERNGNSFTWITDQGIHCVYSPRMRETTENMVAPANPVADGAYNEPTATKGGWPSGNEVYLIGPYYGHDSSFTNQYKTEAATVAEAIGDTDGYTLYSGTAATLDKIAEAVSNGAVVFFDSHGMTDYENGYDCVTGATNSYLCLTSTTGLTSEDYNDGALYYSDGICINGSTIANHMTKNSPAGILWMAICLGMATDTLCEPLREKGVEVVYGYSQSVTFAGDYLYEETFWDSMCDGNSVATAIATMKSTWGNWDWSTKIATEYGYTDGYSTISAARSDYAAFPIVVSDEDTYPGQRSGSDYGACSLQTVKSTYTLFSQYNVTAQSSNTAYGTVSANGSTITATPADGYFAESATVISGTATVNQNGNSFSVIAQSDCTVQINFAAKTPITVSFSGATVSSQYGYSGDSMSLPTVPAPEGYTFLGWMTSALSSDSTEKPSYYTDSIAPTANTTLYALYSYIDENSGTGTGDYVKVTSAPAEWSGEYLIVYEDSGYILDGSLTSFDAVSNYKAVTITNNTIAAAEGEPYKFTIAAVDNGYSIQGTSGGYIGQGSNSNGLTTGSTALINTIGLNASGNVDIVSGGGAYLRYNNTSGQYRFRYYKSSTYTNQQPIALYLKDGSAGTTYYTGNPIQCEHTNTQNVAAVAATCIQSGYTAGVQCVDCGSFISGHEVVEALGHSWSDWTQNVAPGCETSGQQSRTCSVCSETEAQTVAATGHDYEGVVTNPTATGQGYTTYTCVTCGDSYVSDYTEALGEIYTVSFRVPAGVAAVADMECGKNGIILPTVGVPSGEYSYSFEGWTTGQVTDTETKPTVYEAGTSITVSGDLTLYALYSYAVGGTGESGYALKDISQIDAEDVFVITMEYTDGTVYALANDTVSKGPRAVIVSVDDDKLSDDPAANLLWNLGGSSNAYSFYPNGSKNLWLASTSTNNGMSVGTGSNNTYKIISGYLYNNGENRYVGVYRPNPDWRCYTSIHDNIKNQTLGFYVKTESGTTYYTTEFGSVAAAVYGGDQQVGLYASVEEAYAACADGYHVKLLADSHIRLTLSKNLVIDLNGYTLTGTIDPSSYQILGMDTMTDDYDARDQGWLDCDGLQDAVAVHLNAGSKRYMAIEGENGWGFHRYYLGITHISLNTATTGIGYKAVFRGDQQVLAQLDAAEAFGYTLYLEGGRTVTRYLRAEQVASGQSVSLRINNYDVENFGETKLYAYVSATLGGQEIQGAIHDTTLRQVVESVNDNYSSYSSGQLDAVKTLILAHDVMQTWNVSNLLIDPMVQIVQAAYALGPGEALPSDVTLTGIITEIRTDYSTTYKNISVVIAVEGAEDMPILCYRLEGSCADQIDKGDVITVTGKLMNYQHSSGDTEVEFCAGSQIENWIDNT